MPPHPNPLPKGEEPERDSTVPLARFADCVEQIPFSLKNRHIKRGRVVPFGTRETMFVPRPLILHQPRKLAIGVGVFDECVADLIARQPRHVLVITGRSGAKVAD
jgi:hypothetical protein